MSTSEPFPGVDPIVARLRADASASVGGGVLLVFAGVLASLLSVWLVTVVLWLVAGVPGLGFTGWFLLLTLLYAAAAVAWLRARTAVMGRPTFSYVDPRTEWAGVGRFEGPYKVAGPAGDALCFGPKMAWAGLEQGRGREPASREVFFDRCALLLRQLGRAGEAVRMDSVQISDDETPDKLAPVFDYLDRTGWTGRSSDGSRVWLSSRAKVDLPRLGVLSPGTVTRDGSKSSE